jgi:hypothetical protein
VHANIYIYIYIYIEKDQKRRDYMANRLDFFCNFYGVN